MIQYHCRKVSVPSHFSLICRVSPPGASGRPFPCRSSTLLFPKINKTNTTKGEQTNG
nr:MAG TPA: hypothetical protein [Caudoviricetes sp.]